PNWPDNANANGPLSLFPLAVVSWLGAHLGWLGQTRWQHFLATSVFSILSLLMAREGVVATDRLRGKPLTGWRRISAYALLAASPLLWLSVIGYGHIEQALEVGLILLAVRTLVGRRHAPAGIAMGLAILARTSMSIARTSTRCWLRSASVCLSCRRPPGPITSSSRVSLPRYGGWRGPAGAASGPGGPSHS